MTRRTVAYAAIAAAAIFGAVQFVPVRRTNPPVEAPLLAPDEIQAILDRSCADCHTNETRWPWYAYVAPSSWLVARDVEVGRDNLDFSYWGLLSAKEQRELAGEIAREVHAGTMPIRAYLFLHPRSRLSPSEARQLREWFESPASTPGPTSDRVGQTTGRDPRY